jgi:hypothetical protein
LFNIGQTIYVLGPLQLKDDPKCNGACVSISKEQGDRPLRFRFSKHVLEELERRQIPRTLVEGVLESLSAPNSIFCGRAKYQNTGHNHESEIRPRSRYPAHLL